MVASHSIQAAFAADHDRLDNCFHRFRELKHRDFPEAKALFTEFKFGLLRHIFLEEQLLFPLFEAKTGLYPLGPTRVMRIEHRRISAYLEAIHEKIRRDDPDSDAAEQDLLQSLSVHNQKEENILYPALDRLLSDCEKTGTFAAMNQIMHESDPRPDWIAGQK
jgi:iron-sulfur cluster repair protein YtfE (RIC family)